MTDSEIAESPGVGIALLVALVLLFVANSAAAEAPSGEKEPAKDEASMGAIVTDRPDFTESSQTVPVGHPQFEMGAGFATTSSSSVFTPANILVRYGVLDTVELRLGTAPVSVDFAEEGEPGVDGLAETTLAAKVAGKVSKGFRVGVIPWTTAANITGEETFSTGAIGTFSLSGDGAVSVAGNVGVGYTFGDGEGAGLEGTGSLAAGIGLPANFGTYLETYAIIPPGTDPIQTYVDTGILYMVTPHLQIDTYLGSRIPEFDEMTAGAGVSFLL